MKNMEDDLKSSIQNLTGAISVYDSEMNRRLNEDFSEQEIEKLFNRKIDLEQEKAWEERFLELIQRLGKIEEGLDEIKTRLGQRDQAIWWARKDMDNKSYWEIAKDYDETLQIIRDNERRREEARIRDSRRNVKYKNIRE